MDKELCFCIEGNNLYLEQVLVDYNDVPIFFVCRDNTTPYVVLCTDPEKLSYVVVSASEDDVSGLLHGKLPMRDIFTKQTSYWEIVSGEDIRDDLVLPKFIEELDYSVLPDEGACLNPADSVSVYGLPDISGMTKEEIENMCINPTLDDEGNIVLLDEYWEEEDGIRYLKRPIKVDRIAWKIYNVDCNSIIAKVSDYSFAYVFAFSTNGVSAGRLGTDFDKYGVWSKGYVFASGFTYEEVNFCVID